MTIAINNVVITVFILTTIDMQSKQIFISTEEINHIKTKLILKQNK
tara:strand:+ start:4311 stop:4448 length:138 start_codon:yes stop_codon:yes gene_type:complete